MLDVTVDQVADAFKATKNLNSAVKNFLKKEVQNDDGLARFAKQFRISASSSKDASIRFFIQQNLPDKELYFAALARYAHSTFVTGVIEKVVTAHADEFNTTYESVSDEKINVLDAKKFCGIVQEVSRIVDDSLTEASLPVSNFMKKTIFYSIFDPPVVIEAFKCLEK